MPSRKPPHKPHKRGNEQFVAIPYAWLRHPNFRRLSANAVRVFLEMHLGYHGSNNGCISFSVRQAMDCLGSGSDKASKAIDELQDRGFIECILYSNFNLKTRKAREWRLTTQPMNKGAPGHDWKKNHGSRLEAYGSNLDTD